jgi:hypothetical protein
MLRTSPDRQQGREKPGGTQTREVVIPPLGLGGTLSVPRGASALVTFAHGSSSSRFSPRDKIVGEALNESGMATLLFDLFTTEEESDRANVFDIPLLARRVVDAVRWLDGIRHSIRWRSDCSARAPAALRLLSRPRSSAGVSGPSSHGAGGRIWLPTRK